MSRLRADSQGLQPGCLSRTGSSPSQSSDTNLSTTPRPATLLNCYTQNPRSKEDSFLSPPDIIVGTPLSRINVTDARNQGHHNLELQLAIGSPRDSGTERNLGNDMDHNTTKCTYTGQETVGPPDVMSVAIAENAYANEVRRESRKEVEEAEREFESARRMRQQAQAELEKARVMKEMARKEIDSAILMITCHTCKQRFIQSSDCHQHHHRRDLLSATGEINGLSAMKEGGQTS